MRRSSALAVRGFGGDMVWWKVMRAHRTFPRRAAIAAAAASGLASVTFGVAVTVAFTVALPAAISAPAFDGQGYVDSTARCAAPDTAVVFGSTATSRVAICRSPDGDLEYRGVRVRDGARLIAPASRSSDGAFTASNDGIEYMVTSSALVISSGTKVIRDETMLDFHRPGVTAVPAAPSKSPTPTTSLPPPLPAEVGGS